MTPGNGEDAGAIRVEGLTKRFRSFTAVDNVTLLVRRGEVLGLLGPNGAGKSTLIRMLCGIMRPTAGCVHVAGINVVEHAEAVRQHLGYVSQKFSLYDDLTAAENLRLFGGLYGLGGQALVARVQWALAISGLDGKGDVLTRDLGGGLRRRLALGCAMLHRPPILILDEPTSGIDPMLRRQFWELIHQFAAEGVTALVSTHYLDEADYCNRLALMSAGRLVALGTPHELRYAAARGDLVRVECDAPVRAAEMLKAVPGVHDVAIFGNALHVSITNMEPEAALRASLEARGIACMSIEAIEPSLEDVFAQRLGSDSREEPAD